MPDSQNKHLSGLPDPRYYATFLLTIMCEDIPQLYIQMAFVVSRGSFFEAGMTTQVSIITTAVCILFSVWNGGQALCKSSTELGGSLRARASRWSQRSRRSERSQQYQWSRRSRRSERAQQFSTPQAGGQGHELVNPMRHEATL